MEAYHHIGISEYRWISVLAFECVQFMSWSASFHAKLKMIWKMVLYFSPFIQQCKPIFTASAFHWMSFTSFEWTYEIWVSQINVRKLQPKLKRLKTEMLLHRKFQYQMHLEHRLKCSWALNYFETNEITSYLNSVPRAQCTLCSCAPHDVVDFYIHDEKMQQCRIFCSANFPTPQGADWFNIGCPMQWMDFAWTGNAATFKSASGSNCFWK